MACDLRSRTEIERQRRARQLQALSDRLASGQAQLVRSGNSVVIAGWAERGEWCDACACAALKRSAVTM